MKQHSFRTIVLTAGTAAAVSVFALTGVGTRVTSDLTVCAASAAVSDDAASSDDAADISRSDEQMLEDHLLSNMSLETRKALGIETPDENLVRWNPLSAGNAGDLRQYVLASFSAPYPSNDRSLYNARQAESYLYGTLVEPGDTFSFNDTVGERTRERGFISAPEIWGSEIRDGIGGGICEISTILYDACLKANLDIVERSPHSMQVRYVPGGLDAAVSWTTKDFRVRNPYDEPIAVLAGYMDDSDSSRSPGAEQQGASASGQMTDGYGEEDTGGICMILLVSRSGEKLLGGTHYVPVSEQTGDRSYHSWLEVWHGSNLTGREDLGGTTYEGVDNAE